MATLPEQDNIVEVMEKAFRICQEFLAGPWRELTLSQFRFSTVSGGLSNSLYRCSLPENVIVQDSNVPRDVLFRIYGPLQDETNIIVTEAATFMLLAERKLGPKLYGVFPKGRLEEFIPSRSLKTKDYRQMYTEIAKELAKIHALDVPVRKVPDFWPMFMKKWSKEVKDKAQRKSSYDPALDKFYEEETEWIANEIKKSDSPVVYCHNDLQGGNILLRQDSSKEGEPRLMLIDFEFGAYNYRGFDIANQFCEWCFDYYTEHNPFFTYDAQKFPSKLEQTAYIRTYLEQLVSEGVLQESEVEKNIQSTLRDVPLFSMAAHLIWSMWSMKMCFSSSMDSAHREHAKTRRAAYHTFKRQYMEANSFSSDSNTNSKHY